jgi:hypothetical protein
MVSINMGFMAISWLAIMVINYYEGHRLMSYLKNNHIETWKKITYVPGFGSGGTNTFRTMAFVNSADDLNDPMVQWFKENYKNVVTLVILAFMTYPILFIITVVIWP